MHFFDGLVGGEQLQLLDRSLNSQKVLDNLFMCESGVFEVLNHQAFPLHIAVELNKLLLVCDWAFLVLVDHLPNRIVLLKLFQK